MVSEGLITNIVTFIVIALLVVTAVLPKRVRYGANAVIIFILGIIPLLYALGVLPFTFGEAGIIKYVVTAVAVYAAQSLIAEGIREEHAMRWVSIIFGIFIMILAVVPSLHQLGALTFTIPNYPSIVNNILYVITGILLMIGVFLSRE